MLTATKFLDNTKKTPTLKYRPHDCVYDSVYTVGSQKDYEKDLFRLQREIFTNRSFPTYETMFSDNPRYSRNLLHRQTRNEDDNNNFKISEKIMQGPIRDIRVAQMNKVSPKLSASRISTSDILGKYRSKYFASPVSGHCIHLRDSPQKESLLNEDIKTDFQTEVIPPTPPTRNRGTQTDYRDSEAQTDPYSPPYFVRPGTNPEILLIKHLTWGNGLPAGQLEVEMIKRARSRRAGKVEVHKTIVDKDMMKWKKLLQSTDVPVENIYYQEECQETYRDKRLELLAKSLQDLREKHGDLVQERLKALWKRRNREKEQKTWAFNTDKNKELRRLEVRKHASGMTVDHTNIPSYKDSSIYNNSINNNNNEIPIYSIKNNFKTSLNNHYQKTRPKTDKNNLIRYSDLSSLNEIIPSLILSTRNNSGGYSNYSLQPISRSVRKNKLDKDLEEAYLKILESRKGGSLIVTSTTQEDKRDVEQHSSKNEDAETQTESFGAIDSTMSQNVSHSIQNDFSEEQLNIVLDKLLCEHWEAIDKYYNNLLIERKAIDESIDSIL